MKIFKDIPKDQIPSIIQDPFSKNKIIQIMIVGNLQYDKSIQGVQYHFGQC